MDFDINNGVLMGYQGTGSNVVIPAGVKRIDENAFFQNTIIRSVTIPSGVKSIGDGAFYQCENLCSVTIPNTVETIEPNAFWGCNELKSIVIPRSVRTIQEHAFCNCENLYEVTFSEGLETIENDAFNGCRKLASINLPSTIRDIGDDAFLFCNNVDIIEIPSSIRSIGDDAFMFCGGLERVIVFGGTRNEAKIRELREHFPDSATIEWGKNGSSVTSSRTPAKRTNKKEKASKKGGISSYDDRISFDLPNGYVFEDGVDDDGDRTVKIGYNPSVDDDGETQYERTYMVMLKSLDDEDAGKDMLKILEDNNKGAVVNQRLAGKPEAQLIISSTSSTILGIEIRINMGNLLVPVSEKDGIMISCLFPGGGEDQDIYGPVIEQFKTIWSSMVIDGKKTTMGSVDTKSMTDAVKKSLDIEAEQKKAPLDTSVQQDGNWIEIGGRWRMELPFGMRYSYVERENEDDHDQIKLELDRRILGGIHLGKTAAEQQTISSATQMFIMSMKQKDDETQLHGMLGVTLRDDEKMSVRLNYNLSTRGGSIFEFIIQEKQPVSVQTYFVLEIQHIIDDLGEALEKLQNNDFSDGHPFGEEWEQYWRTVVRMAASIGPIDEENESVEFAEALKLDGNIAVRFPVGFKPLTRKGTAKVVYLPTSKKPTQEDLKRSSEFPYCIIQDSGKLDLPLGEGERRLIGELGIKIRMATNLVERNAQNAFVVAPWESMSENAYKAIYLTQRNDDFVPDVVMFTSEGHLVTWQFRSDSGLSNHKLIQIARAFYTNLNCGNGHEVVPYAYPQVRDICHEHLTLAMSGQYTTRRDADFVGQPIRMLMEKCASTGEEAYGFMALPDDSYDLDAQARRLATVFRLEEALFDPYRDTEAMIRLSMFQEVKMFHALRSLAWSVCCMADREGRTLESYSFEELKEIGEPINTNHFNYSTESYCSGLCSHYDWHVFYVPDAYIGSDCEKGTDLRRLCGKENRGGNSISIMMPGMGLGGFQAMNRVNQLIQRCEETLESLDALRKDLIDLLPVMQTIYDGFMVDRDRSQKLEGALAEALTAWCALAIAAKEPFYSEEAADTPEADAGMEGPMQRPTDAISADRLPLKASRGKAQVSPSFEDGIVENRVLKKYTGNGGDVTIPVGITEIADEAFDECNTIISVSIPSSVTSIGNSAFKGCSNLASVSIPEGVKRIGFCAFIGCFNLTSITLPNSLTSIGNNAFTECNHLTSIVLPKGAISAGDGLFMGCRRLETVEIPTGWTSLPKFTFKGCHNLTSITVPESMTDIADSAFNDCPKLSKVTVVGDDRNDAKLNELKALFPGNISLEWKKRESSQIPAASTPKASKNLSKPMPEGEVLDLGGATVIENGKFSGNMTLRNIIIPEGVTEIGEWAFYQCMFLETVAFPKSLKKIGKMAFMSCRALRQVDIPEGVEEIRDHAFGATSSLMEVHLPDSLQTVDTYIFGLGGDSPYATAYMSGELAKRLQANSKDPRHLSAISARRYVIGGVGYANMYDYWNPGVESSERSTNPREINRSILEYSEGRQQRQEQYRPGMERACKEGKTLEEMIEAGRDAVKANPVGDSDAFEKAVQVLDRNVEIEFKDRHFVLTGFGDNEEEVIAEIEKRGGVVHSSMVKKADYLVVALKSPGASKVKKALEWREKGAKNLIVSDYQMWQAIFRETVPSSKTAKKTPEKKKDDTSTKSKPAKSAATERSASKTRSTAKTQVSDVQESVNEVAATVAESADRPLTREEREAVQKAQGILNNMQNQLGQTTSALEKHAETLRKQEEEKQRRIEEAKKKGKSNKDETDMLVMLLNEEALGQLHREDSEFATMYAEDFGAYTESQLLQLRKKVMPAIHNADRVEDAKADMMTRSVEDRFTVSTANFFNVSTDWDFDRRGSLAIEKTALWYKDSELSTVQELMEAHKEKTRQSVLSQLIGYNGTWGSFSTAKKDLQITIEASSDPIPEAHSLFHVEIQGGIHVSISLRNASLGFITIPIMNVFASCWKVSPESIWDAALNNNLNDSRGYAMNSRRDAETGKAKALSAIKPQTTVKTVQNTGTTQKTQPSEQASKTVARSMQSDANVKKIKELEERIATLQREHDSIKGLLGFVKKNKIKKEMQMLQQELYSLRNH